MIFKIFDKSMLIWHFVKYCLEHMRLNREFNSNIIQYFSGFYNHTESTPIKALTFLLHRIGLILIVTGSSLNGISQGEAGNLLPNGDLFESWESPVRFTKTYYVDNQSANASDENLGSENSPFLTINRAAQVLKPGERVVIREGVYREKVVPANGGEGPEKLISYEAAPGANVIIKGSQLIKDGWVPSTGFRLGGWSKPVGDSVKIFEYSLESLELHGYNPFGLINIMMDRTYLRPKWDELIPHILRRGLVYVDGQRLEQVELYEDLANKSGTYWSEHNGMIVHVRLPNDGNPSEYDIEFVTREQVFAPKEEHLGFIRLKGLTFEHAANGFPVPQRGMVSTTRGHHWIIEGCTFRKVNAVALDIGEQDWNAVRSPFRGYMIIRGNHISEAGICGIAGMHITNSLLEDNIIEHIGWHDAELAWESGGIKLHGAKSCLLRRNIIRHITYAPGIWIDYANSNTRITRNVIGDIKNTVRGGIYVEASQHQNMLDQNIIWDITRGKGGSEWNVKDDGGWGIIIDGSDETIVMHNLIGKCEWAGLKTRTVEARIVEGRGGTSIWNHVYNNIFYDSGKSIYFSHKNNYADGNFYAMPAWGGGRGLNWLLGYEVTRVDLGAWQKYFGYDLNGGKGQCTLDVDLDTLTLKISRTKNIPIVDTQQFYKDDFFGTPSGDKRMAGPINNLDSNEVVSINPLNKNTN